jgi:hypothetical protein
MLHNEFAMTDLGNLHFFLGIVVTCSCDGMFLSQWQYVTYLLQRVGMVGCHSSSTPIDTQAKLSDTNGKLLFYATEYMSLAGAL